MLSTYKISKKSAEILCDYDGMNYPASQELKFDSPMELDEIWVKEDMNYTAIVQTIIHEIVEVEIMNRLGWNYWRAHRVAFNSEIIPENLVNMLAACEGKI